MDAPTIVLRYRDTTPGVDSIQAHRDIVGQHGRVAWGWWKKSFEKVGDERISRLFDGADKIDVVLINSDAKKCFRSECFEFRRSSDAPLELVPEYYRASLPEIAGVFLLGPIADSKFDQGLAYRVGEKTMLVIGDGAEDADEPDLGLIEATDRDCVLHLSDLHFGADYAFRREGEDAPLGDGRRTLTECIVEDLRRTKRIDRIGAIVVTGDFFTRGDLNEANRADASSEIVALCAALNVEKKQVIAIAGNHDVVRYPEGELQDITQHSVDKQANYDHEHNFRLFLHEFLGRNMDEPLNYIQRVRLKGANVDVCALNSCTIAATKWTEYGYVGNKGIDAIRRIDSLPLDRPTFRILALHHHLLPVAKVEEPNSSGVSLVLDASDILSVAQAMDINLALHGHQHKPKVSTYRELPTNGERPRGAVHVLANGSAGALHNRLPTGERNTYCVLEMTEDSVVAVIRELRLDGQMGAEVFNDKLETAPLAP